jgi:hypothetical protein
MKGLPRDQDLARFAPRLTVTLLAGFALFLLFCALWALPVLMEPTPPGAIPDYLRERIMARLDGVVRWLFVAAMLISAFASIRGLLPGTRKR